MEQFQTASSTSPLDDYMAEPLLERNSQNVSPPERKHSFDRLFLQRLGRLLRLLFKGTHGSIFKTSIIIPYLMFLLLSCGVEVFIWFVGLIPSRFYAVLVSLDVEGYWKLVPQCLLLVLLVAVVSFMKLLAVVVYDWEVKKATHSYNIRAKVFKGLQAAYLPFESEESSQSMFKLATLNQKPYTEFFYSMKRLITRKHLCYC
jgi:hypothetical protein